MSLHEGERLVKPKDILPQVSEDAVAIVVLELHQGEKPNSLRMSTITINELVMLHAQLGAHITCVLGPMNEC